MNAIPPKATRRQWIGLAVLALPCLLYSMDLTVLHMAVPRLSTELRPSGAQLLWIIDIYGFLVAGSLITMGTLGDRIGRRRLLMMGAVAFAVASAAAAFSRSANQLIATRAVLGLAGATIAPSTLSLIRTMFPDPRQRTTAVGIWITSYSLGSVIGPLVGGLLLEYFHWGSVFLIAVPVMALLLLVGPRLLPEYRDPASSKPDLLSAGLSLLAVLAAIFGLKRIAQDGVDVVALASIGAGAALGSLFVRRQLGLAEPFLDLRLFRAPSFAAALGTYGLSILFLFGGFLFLPQFLQLVVGMSPFKAGVWMLPWALAFVVGSMATPVLVQRVRPAPLMASGLAFAALGFGVFARIDAGVSFWEFAAATTIFSLGMSPVFTLTTDVIIGTAPAERAGAASAISETSAELGGALGIAIFGSIGVAVYRAAMADAVPAGVPEAAAQAARATLGGAIDAARTLPSTVGAQLAQAASEAFVRGIRLCAAVSAAGSAALAVLALVTLRGARSGARQDP